VHHIPYIKKVSNFRISINLDIGVGYGSNLEHVIGVINKVGSGYTDPLWENYIVLSPQFCVNDFADSSIMLKILEKHYLVKTSRESSQKIKIALTMKE
jgi:small conductance mechanosensitive channel